MTALTHAEVLVHPERSSKLDKFLKSLASLGMSITPIEATDSNKLAVIRASTSLKMPDAVVLLQAMKVDGSIATTDQRLVSEAKRKRVGVFHPTN